MLAVETATTASGERGDHFIPHFNRLDTGTCFHYHACELVTHNEASIRGLVAPESVQLTTVHRSVLARVQTDIAKFRLGQIVKCGCVLTSRTGQSPEL